ncbi:MAG: FHA domain-containing protein [Candidatus Eremiobacterota bacterium]
MGRTGPLECDIELEDPQAGNPALQFEVTGGRLYLRPLQPDLLVNGLAVGGRIELEGGESISFGGTTVELRPEPEEVPRAGRRPPAARYGVEVVEGHEGDRGRVEPVVGTAFVIGRQSDCQFVLQDAAVSRQHCILTTREGTCYLNHLGSNPTTVNGVVVDRQVTLHHGDRIRVGERTLLLFRDMNRTER